MMVALCRAPLTVSDLRVILALLFRQYQFAEEARQVVRVDDMAELLNISRRTVFAALARLEAAGIVMRSGGGGRARPSAYSVTEPDGWRADMVQPAAPYPPRNSATGDTVCGVEQRHSDGRVTSQRAGKASAQARADRLGSARSNSPLRTDVERPVRGRSERSVQTAPITAKRCSPPHKTVQPAALNGEGSELGRCTPPHPPYTSTLTSTSPSRDGSAAAEPPPPGGDGELIVRWWERQTDQVATPQERSLAARWVHAYRDKLDEEEIAEFIAGIHAQRVSAGEPPAWLIYFDRPLNDLYAARRGEW